MRSTGLKAFSIFGALFLPALVAAENPFLESSGPGVSSSSLSSEKIQRISSDLAQLREEMESIRNNQNSMSFIDDIGNSPGGPVIAPKPPEGASEEQKKHYSEQALLNMMEGYSLPEDMVPEGYQSFGLVNGQHLLKRLEGFIGPRFLRVEAKAYYGRLLEQKSTEAPDPMIERSDEEPE